MKWGLGAMQMPRKAFWGQSIIEWNLALEGFIESKGGDTDGDAMDRSSLEEMMANYPDEPRDPS